MVPWPSLVEVYHNKYWIGPAMEVLNTRFEYTYALLVYDFVALLIKYIFDKVVSGYPGVGHGMDPRRNRV